MVNEARLDHGCLKSCRQYAMWHGMIPWGLWWYTDQGVFAVALALNLGGYHGVPEKSVWIRGTLCILHG